MYDLISLLFIKKLFGKLTKIIVLRSIQQFFRKAPFVSKRYTGNIQNPNTIYDLSHEFGAPIYNLALKNSFIFYTIMMIMIFCINTSFIILIDLLWHSRKAMNAYFLSLLIKFCLQGLYSSVTPLGRFGPWFSKINMWFHKNINETFFSGHTTLVTIVILYYTDAKLLMHYIPVSLGYIVYINWFVTIFFLLTLRIHYIVDVYASVVTCIMLYLYLL